MDNYITLEHLDQTIWSLLQKIDSKEDNRITNGDIQNWNNKSDFNGDYNNLINTPDIPTAELTSNVYSMLASLGLNGTVNLQAAAAGTAETDTAVVT